MGTISGTLYQALGIGASGNLAKPNATNGITGRVQAVDLGVTTSADFDGATLSFSTGAIAWNSLSFTGSDLADLATADHADLTAGTGSNTHAQIDTHLGLTDEHLDWTDDQGGTNIHTGNYNAGGAGTDTDAIHVNVAQEISGITEEASPAGSDLILIESLANGTGKRRVQINNLPGGTDADAIHDNVAQEFSAISNKAAPTTDDLFLIEDVAASTGKKYVIFANVSHTIIGDVGSTTHANLDVHVTGTNPHSGSAASGANSDITSLTGLTTPLAAEYGGTENAFTKFSGPATAERTFILPNANSTIAVSGGAFHDTFSDFAAGEHRIINDASTSTTELWSSTKIGAEFSAVVSGTDRRRRVIDYVAATGVPPTETSGHRYILDDSGTPHANWDDAEQLDIVEFNGIVWEETDPVEGFIAFDDAANADRQYVDDGSPAWELRSAAATHNTMSGLQGGQASEYYHMTSAQHTEVTGWTTGSDISAAEMETLTDGSDAGSLHIHDSDYYTEGEIDTQMTGKLDSTFTKAELDTAVTDGNVMYDGDPLANLDTTVTGTELNTFHGLKSNYDAAYTHGTGSGSDHADVATNTTHSSGDGSDHADVATNTTHATGTGADHADVATNTTHSGGDGSDHSDVAANTVHATGTGADHGYLDQSVTGGSSPTFDGANFTGIPVDTGISGTAANFDTACSDDNFAFEGGDNVFTGTNDFQGETMFDTFILGGDGASPTEGFCVEIPFTVVNPSGTGAVGDLMVMEDTGDVTRRTAGTQVPVGFARTIGGPGEPIYVCVAGRVPCDLKTGDTPTRGTTEVFARNDASQHEVTSTPPTAGKVFPYLFTGTTGAPQVIMLGGLGKPYEFET